MVRSHPAIVPQVPASAKNAWGEVFQLLTKYLEYLRKLRDEEFAKKPLSEL